MQHSCVSSGSSQVILCGAAEYSEVAYDEEKNMLITADVCAGKQVKNAESSAVDFIAVVDRSGNLHATVH